MPDTTVFAVDIPPSSVVRDRLAVVATEAALLRKLLPLALRREREAERLARMKLLGEASTHGQ
jgi:hypothetical protein